METHIRLSLSRHCIQTECVRLYNKAVSAYFKAGDEADRMRFETRIELLRQTLSGFDFGYLRSRFPEFSGHTDADIELGVRRDGQIEILINGVPAYASEPKFQFPD